jgi:hypothetical protein
VNRERVFDIISGFIVIKTLATRLLLKCYSTYYIMHVTFKTNLPLETLHILKKRINPLTAATSLGVKRFLVLNTTINIKDIL